MKIFLSIVFTLFLTQLKAQTFQEYLEQFPLITGQVEWKDSDLALIPSDKSKQLLDEKFFKLIGGSGQWGTADLYMSGTKTYPLGRVETKSAVVVFLLSLSFAYDPQTNTQMAVNAYSYVKKNGDMIRGGMNNYLLSIGGDPVDRKFMYTGYMRVEPKKVYVNQDGTGDVIKEFKTFSISDKGMVIEF